MKKVRVLWFHPALAPYRLDLFNALSQRCLFRVVFLRDNLLSQNFDQELLRSRLRAEHSYLSAGFTLFKRTVRFGIGKQIADFRPEVVVTPEFSPTTLSVALLRIRRGHEFAHVICTEDNEASVSSDTWIRAILRRLVLRRVDGLSVLSEEAADFYKARFGAVLPIGVSPYVSEENAFRNHVDHARATARRFLSRYDLVGRRVLLFVGRLVNEKRPDRLLRAFAAIHEEIPDALLVFVGEGKESGLLCQLAQQLQVAHKTLLVGRLEGSSLLAWYAIGSVLVLPSAFEPFGAVVSEALLAGMPVICSNRAGARTLVKDGENGTLVDAANTDQLQRAMIEWLRRSSPLGTNSLNQVRPSLMLTSFQDAVDGFLGLLSAVHEARKPPVSQIR